LVSKRRGVLIVIIIVISGSVLAGAFFSLYQLPKSGPSGDNEDIVLYSERKVSNYAAQRGISREVIKMLSPLDADRAMDDNEKVFVDYLSSVCPRVDYLSAEIPHLQQKVIDAFMADGAISRNEVYQMHFLCSLPKADEEQIINAGNVANADIDGDGMINYFEHCIAKTPYNVYNGRYAIILTTDPNSTAGDILEKFLINEQKFETRKIVKLVGNDGTKVNFLQAISDVSHRATENDLVYISFDGHGNREGFAFNDGNGDINSGYNPSMTFTEIDKEIDNIKAGKLLITTSSCAGDAPVSIISGPKRVVADVGQYWVTNTAGMYQTLGASPGAKLFDLDGNGYVSFDEIFKIFSKYQTEGSPEWYAKMSDSDGIAPSLYLGDYRVADLSS
jgi:hypothetical protein